GERLPTEPLVQKAIEGGAKHVSGERIVKAVEANLVQLRTARALLAGAGDTAPAAREILSVVAARKRGLGDPVIARLVAALPSQPRSAALHAVADLEAHGFQADSGANLILEAVRQSMSGGRLLDVAAAAIQETQRGHTHDEALAIVRAELPNVPTAPPPAQAAVQRARRPIAASGPPEH
ncbi:MAG TPA: hypothetical protein VN848_00215, partial [Gemmatimonadales bacterium]|nr:hypothetical protein [Gemmatimonadales bacterium]